MGKIWFNRTLGFLQQQFDKSIILLDTEHSVRPPDNPPTALLRAATRHCTICLLRHTQLCGQQRLKEIALKRLFKQESWLIHPHANCLATAAGRRQQSPLLLYRGISLWDEAERGWNRDPGITECCKVPAASQGKQMEEQRDQITTQHCAELKLKKRLRENWQYILANS